MALNHALIAELQQEAANTHKMLERVPEAHMDWQPHAKSMSLSRLAAHIAELPDWITMTLHTNELDLGAKGNGPGMAQHTKEITDLHNKNAAAAQAALQQVTDEQLAEPWTLRNGDHVILTMPKAAVIRSVIMNHMIHHRGQLSVYLRLLDVPLPGIYGPTRDEIDMMAAAQQ